MLDNIITMTDGYKVGHWNQYPPDTTLIHSYMESRGGAFPETTFFGLQYYLTRYLQGTVVNDNKINLAARQFSRYGSNLRFDEYGWRHIINAHKGRLPLHIKAVPEGKSYPTRTPLLAIENTCPACFWVTNYVETILSMVWYPSTVASLGRAIRQVINTHLERSGTPDTAPWRLHDFGYRGVSSPESAAIGGAAHLINFRGTDNNAGVEFLDDYYLVGDPIAETIPASEHSTITAWGKGNELEAFRNMLEQYPTGLVACVSDSYDIRHAVSTYWGQYLQHTVMTRDGTLVVRPDSGDPATVVLDVVMRLAMAFGAKVNEKGYRVLDPHVRVIQGDGVNLDTIHDVYDTLEDHGYSSDNVSFGMGGALLQRVDRDTQKFAIKASYIERGDVNYGISKNPVDAEWKRSREGRQFTDEMQTVFLNGEVHNRQTFADVRERATR